MAELIPAGGESVKPFEKSLRGPVATPACLLLPEWAWPGDGVTAHTLSPSLEGPLASPVLQQTHRLVQEHQP